MGDYTSLKVLDRFKWLFQKLHIDYEVMRKILQLKLTMDARRMPTVFNGSKVKKEGNQFVKSLWLYVLYGLILLTPFLFLGDQFIFSVSIMFSVLMFILMTSMVSDYSAVLLDIRDKNILHTKPISTRTLNAAKIAHILIYMFLLTGSFVIIPLVVSIIRHGITFALIFAIEIILISCLVVVLTAFVYLFILRFFSGEKLKDIINYVQIILSIAVMIGYQLVIRSFDIINLDITYTYAWWHLLLPPIWFGAPFELFLNNNLSPHIIIMTIFALLAPILSIVIYICLMSAFERNLAKLASDSNRKKMKSRKLAKFWSNVLCRTKEERTFYMFSSLMMTQERDVKLKIYPQIGMAFIIPFIFLFNELRDRPLEEVAAGNTYMIIYFSLIMIPTVIHMLKFSGTYKGQWIFRAAPIHNESSIYSGTLKACIINYFIPVFLVLSVLFGWLFSIRILPDLFVVLLVAIAITLVSYIILNGEVYPFSNSHEHTRDISSLKVFGGMLVIGLFVIVHLILSKIPFGLYVYMLLLIIGILIGWKKTFPRNIKKEAIR
ncbi:hypothetical protein [Psychrobacillus sp. OK032]|uniref:hypothetical protein n=1 Tax=Psychrobacillus sp. OK032 TaxID=1884358 RepID=UPI0008CD40A0|nr:hypothetical protein [Psychrobacillus sp. OK032]SES35580.1 hypothetical protein SAMN05518872_108233 [Psychrobacillus sp. OK032]